MIKWVLFFILFFPFVSAIAVTPTNLDLTGGSEGKVYIYNTLETEVNIQVDGAYRENFTLAPEEKKILAIYLQGERPGTYEGKLIIKEIYENGFINAIEIPIEYSGSFSPTKKEMSYTFLSGGVFVMVMLILVLYIWKRRKKVK